MGMDLIEIVVRTEGAFDITIPDEEAVKITTTKELADLVARQVVLGNDSQCLTQQSFYLFRNHFLTLSQFPRAGFRRDTHLTELLPKHSRRRFWSQLRTNIAENALPDLVRPIWLFSVLSALTAFILTGVAYTVQSSLSIDWINATACGFAGATGFAFMAEKLTRSAKTNFPLEYARVGDIANYLVANKPHILKRNEETWTYEQILNVIREIVTDYGAPQDFSNDARFVEDLHLD